MQKVQFFLGECNLSGWDIGAYTVDGGNILSGNCKFEDNVVGLEFNTKLSYYSWDLYENMSFINNQTAVKITRLRAQEVLRFVNGYFSGNENNINNLDNHAYDLSEATVE